MASWLARSLANSLRLDDDGDGGEFSGNADDEEGEDGDTDVAPHRQSDSSIRSYDSADHQHENRNGNQIESEAVDEAQSRGVKDDLTELKHTLSRQLWGVANFLAPPPSHGDSSPSQSDPTVNGFDRLKPPDSFDYGDEGEREPLDEAISGIKVSEMDSKSDRVESVDETEFEEELEDEYPVGVTDEVLAFARNIAMHPETWLDFPLDSEDDLNDFKMSTAQQEHAFAIENLAPRLRALRIEFCPCHMTGSYFWKVYFVLLHSRLDKHDADILSTPQVMEARSMWMQELKKKTKEEEYDWPGNTYRVSEYETEDTAHEEYPPDSLGYFHSGSMAFRAYHHEPSKFSTPMYIRDIEKHSVVSSEVQTVDKSVIEETTISVVKDTDVLTGFTFTPKKMAVQNFNDDEDDDWLEEEDSDLVGYSGAVVSIGIDEDVSFSDLEDDLDVTMPLKSQPIVGQKNTYEIEIAKAFRGEGWENQRLAICSFSVPMPP